MWSPLRFPLQFCPGNMTKGSSEHGTSGGGFHAVHAERDLESNWEVDLAKKLEEYLLKICSGEITGEEEGHVPVNFAEGVVYLTQLLMPSFLFTFFRKRKLCILD